MIHLLLLVATLWHAPRSAQTFPTPAELERDVWQGLQLDAKLRAQFTHLERRRDVTISRLGKVTIGPLRTFEVHPSEQPGGTYKRLLEVDGKPLTAAELATRDAEHERDLREAAARDGSETPRQRAARLEKALEGQRHRDAMLADAMNVFQATVTGREWVEGQPVLVADVKARPDAHVTTREGRWMKRFAGQIWIAEANHQVVRLDMRALQDVTIGWGVIGRVHAGSRVLATRQYLENVWLPASLTYEASGRTLLFRPFQFTVTTTYSDFRRQGKVH